MISSNLLTLCKNAYSDADTDGVCKIGGDHLLVVGETTPTVMDCTVYDPLVCLIIQGAKETGGPRGTVSVSAGQSLAVSHGGPVMSRITKASVSEPYLSVVLFLDMALLRSINEDVLAATPPQQVQPIAQAGAIETHYTDPALQSAFERLMIVQSSPTEAEVLGPLILRELYARLLLSPHGGSLRALMVQDGTPDRVARAITHIRRNFVATLPVGELAQIAGMSLSSFHDHFKTATGLTPLQYQKDLRLIEARSQLRSSDAAISTVAFEVGYESATQFTREYSRKFHASPSVDRRAPLAPVA